MPVLELKKKYNDLLARSVKAHSFLADKDVPWEKKEPHLQTYYGIIRGMESIFFRIAKEEMVSKFNRQNGFVIDKKKRNFVGNDFWI